MRLVSDEPSETHSTTTSIFEQYSKCTAIFHSIVVAQSYEPGNEPATPLIWVIAWLSKPLLFAIGSLSWWVLFLLVMFFLKMLNLTRRTLRGTALLNSSFLWLNRELTMIKKNRHQRVGQSLLLHCPCGNRNSVTCRGGPVPRMILPHTVSELHGPQKTSYKDIEVRDRVVCLKTREINWVWGQLSTSLITLYRIPLNRRSR